MINSVVINSVAAWLKLEEILLFPDLA